jgi:hypothetical protein
VLEARGTPTAFISSATIVVVIEDRICLRVLLHVSVLAFGLGGEGRDLRAPSLLKVMSLDDVPAVQFVLLGIHIDTNKTPFSHLFLYYKRHPSSRT